MTYAISYIHGCYDKYQRLLEKICFGLGPHGFKILLDMVGCPNVRGILGNHEAMAIDALSVLLSNFFRKGEPIPKKDEADKISLWFGNGGESSLMDFADLGEAQVMIAWKTLQELPLYLEAEVGGRKYLLVHGELDGFSPDRPLEDIPWRSFCGAAPVWRWSIIRTTS